MAAFNVFQSLSNFMNRSWQPVEGVGGEIRYPFGEISVNFYEYVFRNKIKDDLN